MLLLILFAKIIDNNFWHSLGLPKLKLWSYFWVKFLYKSKNILIRSVQQKCIIKLCGKIIQNRFLGPENCWKIRQIIGKIIDYCYCQFFGGYCFDIDNKKSLHGWQSAALLMYLCMSDLRPKWNLFLNDVGKYNKVNFGVGNRIFSSWPENK